MKNKMDSNTIMMSEVIGLRIVKDPQNHGDNLVHVLVDNV